MCHEGTREEISRDRKGTDIGQGEAKKHEFLIKMLLLAVLVVDLVFHQAHQ